jgi:hypothetical protein
MGIRLSPFTRTNQDRAHNFLLISLDRLLILDLYMSSVVAPLRIAVDTWALHTKRINLHTWRHDENYP